MKAVCEGSGSPRHGFVDVHVGRGSRATLHHVDRKMRCEDFAGDQPLRGPLDCLCETRLKQSQFEIGRRGGLLDHS